MSASTFFIWFFTSQATLQLPGPFSSITAPPAVFLVSVFLLILSVGWAAHDGAKRGKSKFWVGFFIVCAGWPLSLLYWRWLRPPFPPRSLPSDPPPLPH